MTSTPKKKNRKWKKATIQSWLNAFPLSNIVCLDTFLAEPETSNLILNHIPNFRCDDCIHVFSARDFSAFQKHCTGKKHAAKVHAKKLRHTQNVGVSTAGPNSSSSTSSSATFSISQKLLFSRQASIGQFAVDLDDLAINSPSLKICTQVAREMLVTHMMRNHIPIFSYNNCYGETPLSMLGLKNYLDGRPMSDNTLRRSLQLCTLMLNDLIYRKIGDCYFSIQGDESHLKGT